MAYNYIATAYPSHLVKFSAIGHFVHETEQHLLTIKPRMLELYAIEHEELISYQQCRIPSNVVGLWTCRMKNAGKDLIILLTQQNELFIMEFMLNNERQTVDLLVKCQGKFPVVDDVKVEPIAAIHPENRFMCLALYAQRLEFVDFSQGWRSFMSYPVRCPSADWGRILAMDFLSHHHTGSNTPALVSLDFLSPMVFLQSTPRGRVLAYANMNPKAREKEKAFASYAKLDSDVNVMLTVPGNGFVENGALAIGNGCVQYFNAAKQYVAAASPVLSKLVVTAHCLLYKDMSTGVITYLLAGADGRLILIVVRLETGGAAPSTITATDDAAANGVKHPPCRLNVEFLGMIPVAQTMTVVGHGLVYIGACAGPGSYLIKLRAESLSKETRGYYDVIQTFPALGAILELHVVKNAEGQGLHQSYLWASTADTFGQSLTIVRSGINLQDPMDIPLAGMQKAWRVVLPNDASLSFILSDFHTTRLATMTGDGLTEMAATGKLRKNARTFLFSQVSPTVCLQVISSGIYLLGLPEFNILDEFLLKDLNITSTRMCKNTLAVANGTTIHLLDITDKAIISMEEQVYEDELCALEIFTGRSGGQFVAAGEWKTSKISIVECGTKTVIEKNLTPDDDLQPRSLMFCRFSDGVSYFFIGRGNGSVDYFLFDEENAKMTDFKTIPLGTRLVTFVQFRAQGQINIFACSDRPCVISCRHGKLLFSNVNIEDAVDVCPFEPVDGSTSFDHLLVVKSTSLSMGHLEDIQKIHFIPFSLGFQVVRLSFQAESATLAVLGVNNKTNENSDDRFFKVPEYTDERMLYVLNTQSLQTVAMFKPEHPQDCLTCLCHWNPDRRSLLVLGLERDRSIPVNRRAVDVEKKIYDGYIIILELIHDKLQVLHTQLVPEEPVRNVAAFGELLLASTDGALLTFEWLAQGHQLDSPKRLETAGLLNGFLEIVDNTVLIGDFQKAITVAEFNPTSRTFHITATDYTYYGFVSLMQRSKMTLMGGDDRGNLLVLGRKENASDGDVSQAYQPVGWIGMGDSVTTIKRGSLVSRESIGDVSVKILDNFVFGTSKGQLGVIFELEPQLFHFLKHVESCLLGSAPKEEKCQYIAAPPVGRPDLVSSLRISGRVMEADHAGFIDGDLVETALNLPRKDFEKIVQCYKVAPAEHDSKCSFLNAQFAQKVLEDLIRLH